MIAMPLPRMRDRDELDVFDPQQHASGLAVRTES